MNVQLKSGQTYTNPENGFTYDAGFGGIRDISFNIIRGSMADPLNFKANANVNISFYANDTEMLKGSQPIYSIYMNLRDAEIIAILDVTENGFEITEKKIYEHFLSLDGYSDLFELV